MWDSNVKHFYKSRTFVAPDASTTPLLDKFTNSSFDIPDICGNEFNYQLEMADSSPASDQGHWVPEGGFSLPSIGPSSPLALERHPEQLSRPSSLTFSETSSDQSSIFSWNGSGTGAETHATPPDISIHVRRVPGWPSQATHLTAPNSVAVRRTGEKMVDDQLATSVVSGIGPSRTKAVADWVTGFIYGQIMNSSSSPSEPVAETYNVDAHYRVANRIQSVIELTSLPPSTVFLALWYISRFQFAVSATVDNTPRAAFYQLLCGYGTVSTEETTFIAFIAGAMLANKANDDHCLSMGEWEDASLYGINDLKILEVCALKSFGWSITIDSARWVRWIEYIAAHHSVMARYQAVSRNYGVVSGVINRVSRQDPHWYCDCERTITADDPLCDISADYPIDTGILSQPLPTYYRTQFQLPPSSNQPIDTGIPSQPLPTYYRTQFQPPPSSTPPALLYWKPDADTIIYRPSQVATNLASGVDRGPTTWYPPADPIVETARPVRTVGTAPGTTWTKPTTVLDILENFAAGCYPTLLRIGRSCGVDAVNIMPHQPYEAFMDSV